MNVGGVEFELAIENGPPETSTPDGEPALIHVDEDLVRVEHARLAAVIDPFARRVRLRCAEEDRHFAVEITQRAALSAMLPLQGGILLHSAGIVVGDRAVAFFGPSGAGKSTLASLVDEPVLSDELIAIVRDGVSFRAMATGFWGELEDRPHIEGTFPLAHLVELGRGEGVSLSPLSAREAARALVGVAVVPPHPRLWREALPIIDALAQLKTSRLRWTPGRENARGVIACLRTELKIDN